MRGTIQPFPRHPTSVTVAIYEVALNGFYAFQIGGLLDLPIP